MFVCLFANSSLKSLNCIIGCTFFELRYYKSNQNLIENFQFETNLINFDSIRFRTSFESSPCYTFDLMILVLN